MFFTRLNPFIRSFSLAFSHLGLCLSSSLLDGPENSRYVLLGRAHICAVGINFCEVGKNRGEKIPNYWRGFFFIFSKTLKMRKSDGNRRCSLELISSFHKTVSSLSPFYTISIYLSIS